MLGQQADRTGWIDRQQHHGLAKNPAQAHDRQDREPKQHHRAENLSDGTCALFLDDEKSDQHDHRNRQHGNLRIRCRNVQTFDGAQHRNRRRDGAVREK
jgi:hypothetical protein